MSRIEDKHTQGETLVLPAPLFVDLRDNGGFVSFKTFDEAAAWADAEREKWRFVASQPLESPFEEIVMRQLAPMSTIMDLCQSVMAGTMTPADGAASIRRCLDAYLTFKVVHSASVPGRMAMTMGRYRPLVLGLLAGVTGSAAPDDGQAFDKPADSEAFTFGYAIGLPYRSSNRPERLSDRIEESDRRLSDFVSTLSVAEAELSRLREGQDMFREAFDTFKDDIKEKKDELEEDKKETEISLSDLIADAQKTFDETVSKMSERLAVIKNEHEDNLLALKETIASHMHVRAAVDYWNDTARLHLTRAGQSTAWFVISGLSILTVLLGLLYGLRYFDILSQPMAPLILVFLLGMPTGAGFWLLKMVAGTRREQERLANRAQERVAMVESFLALESEGQTHDNERLLLLESLFRPLEVAEKESRVSFVKELLRLIRREKTAFPKPGERPKISDKQRPLMKSKLGEKPRVGSKRPGPIGAKPMTPMKKPAPHPEKKPVPAPDIASDEID